MGDMVGEAKNHLGEGERVMERIQGMRKER
jgi:hypothetical protein